MMVIISYKAMNYRIGSNRVSMMRIYNGDYFVRSDKLSCRIQRSFYDVN